MKKFMHKLLAFLMVLAMLLDAAPVAVLAEGVQAKGQENPPLGYDSISTDAGQGEALPIVTDVATGQKLGINVEELHALAEGEYSVTAVEDPSDLLALIARQAEAQKSGMAKMRLRAMRSAPATQKATGYVAYDIELTEAAAAAKEYRVTVPVGVDMLKDYRVKKQTLEISNVSYELYHIHTDEKEDTTLVETLAVDVSADNGVLNDFSFTVDSFSSFVLKYTVDFVYRSAEGKIRVNFENLQENSNELSHISYDSIQKVTMLPVADIFADAPVKTDDEQDCSEVYVVYLHDGTAKEEFDKEFFSQAAVSIEGKGVEYSEGAIRLTGDVQEGKVTFTSGYKTLEVEISNYIAPPVVPEDVEGFAYRFFAVGETAAVADILAANEIVSSYYNIVSLSDEKAVTEKDGSLSAQDYFDAVTLTVALSDGSEVEITLSNPAPVQAGETVTTAGVGTFAADKDVPAGTMLVVDSNPVVPEGIVLPGTDTKAGEQPAPVFFEVSLVAPDGEPVKAGADVTLNTAIQLPEAPKGQIVKVTGVKVYHIGEKGDAEELEGATYALAEGRISSVSFTTPGFSLFAITYTVEYIEINYNGVINLDFTGFEPYPKEGVDATFIYDTDNCDIRVSVEKVLETAMASAVAGDNVASKDSAVENFEIDFANTAVTSSEGGVALEKGVLVISGDGSIVLSDGEKTLTINITGITKLSEEILKADGVEIKVEEGNIPLGSQAQYIQNSEEKTASLVEEHKLGEGEENITGYSSADLKIVRNDEPVNAEGQFKVTLEKSSLIPEGMKLDKLYHIHSETDENGETVSIVETLENVNETKDGQLEFTLSNFSDIVASYTVDFEYTDPETGDKIVWSWPGRGSYKISDIMAEIRVTSEIDQVSLVRTVDVGGLEEALYLEQKEDGWYLTSDASFSDTFELTVVVEGKPYIFTVVDENVSNDLSIFLGEARFDNVETVTTGENGKVKVGRTYQLHLTFAETNGGNQFDATQDLVYRMPEGFNIDQLSENFSITYKGTSYSGNTLSYDPDTRILTVHFSDTVKTLVATSADASFVLDITGVFTGEQTQFEFGNGQTKNFIMDNTHDASVQKTGQYYASDNKVHYTITAHSDGMSQNVIITDTVTGTALHYDQGSVQYWGNSATPTINENADGFTFSVPGMMDGETISIIYTASVDFSNITGKGTVSQTGNTVTIQATDDETETVPTDVSNQIDYNPLSKSSGQVTGDGTIKTVPWTITVNQDQIKSMAGTAITDEIGGNSRGIMHYSGNGITVSVMNGDYTISSYTVPWIDLGVTDLTAATGWTYTIPENQDTLNNTYKYVISYTTDVDTTGKITDFNVDNTVHDDDNHQSSGGANVTPGEDAVTLNKVATSYSAAASNWEISFNVPRNGLSNAVVTDYFPTTWPWTDALIGDVAITGLLDSESYTVDTSDSSKVVITFYKSSEKTDENQGLLPSDSDREIKVTLTTQNTPEWVIAYSGSEHRNNVQLNVNGQVITDSDATYPRSEGISKTGYSVGTRPVGGRQYPLFRYVVSFYGISDDSFLNDLLTFTDDYNEQYLTLATDYDTDNALYITDRYGNNKSDSIVAYTDANGVLTFNVNKDRFKKDGNGMYQSAYQMVYYLTAKNDTALTALELASINAVEQNRIVPLSNRVDWGKFHDEVNIDYKYPAVDKETVSIDANSRTAKYKIVLNPDKIQLNGGNSMELIDSAVNLSIDYSTIEIETDPACDISYYFRGNTGYFTIPDATKVTIQYSARIIGDGNVTYSNEASMKGYRDDETNTTSVSATGSGNINIEWALIYKHEYRKMEHGLNGAVYVLTDRNGNPIVYPATAKSAFGFTPGQPVTFTTSRLDLYHTPDGVDHYNGAHNERDGYAWVFLDKEKTGLALQKGITYYFKELTPPPGYQRDNTIFNFTIAEHPDYDDYEYYSGDVLRIADTPVNRALEVRKTLDGAEKLTDTQKQQITFRITAVDANGDLLSFPYGAKDAAGNALTTTELNISYADFENGVYRLDDLPSGTYTVTETDYSLGGYTHQTTTYQVDGSGPVQTGYTGTVRVEDNSTHYIAYTNEYQHSGSSLTVIKKDAQQTMYLYGATFQLLKKDDGTGNYAPVTANYLTQDGKFTIEYENRETGVTLPSLADGEYRLIETQAPANYVLDDTPINFTVASSEVSGTNGSHFTFANNSVTITNEIAHTYTLTKVDSLRLSKKLNGAEFKVYELTSAETVNSEHTYTLGSQIGGTYTTDENGKVVIDAKSESGFDPLKVYAIKETKAPAGYQLSDKMYFFYVGQTPPSLAATLTGWQESIVNLYNGPQEASVPNEPDSMDLYVRKWWWKVTETAKETDRLSDDARIEVKLYQIIKNNNGDVVSTNQYPDDNTTYFLTMGGAGNNSFIEYQFTGLPTGKSDNTAEPLTYSYYVEEVVPEGYVAKYRIGLDETDSNTDTAVHADPSDVTVDAESENKSIQIRNSLKPISLKMRKVWLDDGTHAGGNTISFSLRYTDNAGVEKTPTSEDTNSALINPQLPGNSNVAGDSWAYEWTRLNPGTPDNPRHYYVLEGNQQTLTQYGYGEPVYSRDEDGNVIITNTKHTTDSNKVKVKKVWMNEDGTLISDISSMPPVEVQLMKEAGTPGTGYEVTLNISKHNRGTYYDYNLGQNVPYDYGIYTSTNTYTVATGSTISFVIYAYNGDGKIFDGDPDSNPNELGTTSLSQTITIDANTTLTYWISDNSNQGLQNVSYTSPEPTWSGVVTDVTSSDPITQNGGSVTTRQTLNNANSWGYTWENLASTDGNVYRYSVREVNVPAGYNVEYENNDGVTTGIIYVKNVKSEYTRATAYKKWLDASGNEIPAPSGASVVFTLYQDGRKTNQTVTLDGVPDANGEADAWMASFEGLELNKADGTPHVYTIKELTGYTGYSAHVKTGENTYAEGIETTDGGTIYNKKARTVTAVKTWQKSDGTTMLITDIPYGTTVVLTLKKDGETVKTLTLDGNVDIYGEQQAWVAVFSGLDDTGTYTVKETGVPQGFQLVSTDVTDGVNTSGDCTYTIVNKEKDTDLGKLTVTKAVSGTDAQGSYQIAVKDANGHYYDIDGTDKGTTAFYVTFSKDQSKTWENLNEGVYTVEEADANVQGYTLAVTGTGNVTVSNDTTATATVTNTYTTVTPTSYAPKITKSFTGTWPSGQEFTFTLAADSSDLTTTAAIAAGNVVLPGTHTQNATSGTPMATFGNIQFKTEGTYKFTITETVPVGAVNASGETYSAAANKTGWFVKDSIAYWATPVNVAVEVTDTNGVLSVTKVTYDGTAYTSDSIGTASGSITNKTAEAVKNAEGTKVLTGRAWKDGGETFQFTLTPETDTATAIANGKAVLPAAGAGYTVSGNVITVTAGKPDSGNEKTFTFPNITFKAPGTYTFTMAEVNGGTTANNLAYASNTVTVTYEVTVDTNGELQVTRTYNPNTEPSFTNAYTDNASTTFSVQKTLVGGTLNEHPFTFTLTQVQGNERTAQATENVKLSTPKTITVNAEAATETKAFTAAINFDQDDVNKEFWFLIEENAPQDIGENNISGNILYDATRQHWIKVTVEIDANDELIVKKNDAAVTDNPDASFTNTVLTSIHAKKVWTLDGTTMTTWPTGKTVTFQLQKKTVTGETENWVAVTGNDAIGNAIKNDVIVNSAETVVSFTNLPNNEEYRIVETKVDGETLTQTDAIVATGTGYGTSENPLTITNPLTTVTVTKAWSSSAGTQAPANASIVLGLFKGDDHNTPVSSITLNGTVDPETSGEESATPAYPSGNSETAYEYEAWKAKWTNLPVTEPDGTAINYVVKETTGVSGYTVSYDSNGTANYAANGGTITNTLNETDIKIVKVVAGTTTTLSGAHFKLEKQNADGTTWSKVAAYTDITVDGEATITNLTDGTYRLTEIQAPAGYNMLSGAITFTITNGVAGAPTGPDGITIGYVQASAAIADDPETTDVDESAAASPATYTIPNTPGVELPATGGSGTLPYYLTGLTLTLGAALWLILSRRKREQN